MRVRVCVCASRMFSLSTGCHFSVSPRVPFVPPLFDHFGFCSGQKEAPQQGPLPEHRLPPDIFQSTPSNTHSPPSSSQILSFPFLSSCDSDLLH